MQHSIQGATQPFQHHANRLVVLIALLSVTICCGGIYAWSVFSPELAAFRHWDYAAVTFAFSILAVMECIYGTFVGVLLDKWGPRVMVYVTAVFWGLGWIFTGLSTEIWILYLAFGFYAGLGSASGYNPMLTTAVRWYPDKKGLVSGIITGGIGLSSLFIAPFARMLLSRFNVSVAFIIIGALFFVIICIAGIFVKTPPRSGLEGKATGQTDFMDLPWQKLLRSKRFYCMWLFLICSSIPGLMLIGNASIIGQEAYRLSAQNAAYLVSLMAVSNFTGRIVMGILSDKIGPYISLILAMGMCFIGSLILNLLDSLLFFVISVAIVMVSFGAIFSVLPTVASQNFGLKNLGANYGIIFTAYGVAAIVGPMTVALARKISGDFGTAFLMSGAFAIVALVLVVIMQKLEHKQRQMNLQRKCI